MKCKFRDMKVDDFLDWIDRECSLCARHAEGQPRCPLLDAMLKSVFEGKPMPDDMRDRLGDWQEDPASWKCPEKIVAQKHELTTVVL